MKLKFGGITVDVDDAGRVFIVGEYPEDETVVLDEREARWLAIVALPAMLPGMKTAAEERRDRG